MGMEAVGQLALAMGLWQPADQERQRAVIAKAGLPLALPPLDVEAALQTLQSDKKVNQGQLRFVLPTGIGHVVIRNDVDPALIRQLLAGSGARG